MGDVSISAVAAAVPRPRLEARRRAFLDAATAMFLDKGYAGTTLDDIIARSGGSRQTLYVLFGGKQGLFEALVAERSDTIFGPFPTEYTLGRTPEDVLVDVGIRYLQAVTTPEAIGVYRLVIAEGVAMRELADRFWAVGPSRSRAFFAQFFLQQSRKGTLRVGDPEQAADAFMGMLLGSLHMQCVLGLRPAPQCEEIETHVRAAVARFIDGCRA